MTSYTCPRHGQYLAVDLGLPEGFGTVPITVAAQCQACTQAANALKQQTQALVDVQRATWTRWQEAEIPRRFKNRTVANWRPTTKQAAAARIVHTWLSDLDARWKTGEGLLLMGVPGVGKTHLLAGLLTAAVQAGHTARYASWPDIWAKCRPPYSEHPEELMRALRKVDFLALDEIGLTVSTEKEQARLFELIDSRYSRRRPTLIATNATAATLASIGERTADRLREACVAISIPGDSYRGRAPTDKVLLDAPWPISEPTGDALRYVVSVDGQDVEREWEPKAA